MATKKVRHRMPATLYGVPVERFRGRYLGPKLLDSLCEQYGDRNVFKAIHEYRARAGKDLP
jgi:hypothetical protein